MAGENPPADEHVLEYEDPEKFDDFSEVDASSVNTEEDDFDESAADFDSEEEH